MAQGAPVVTSRGTSTEEVAGDAGVLVDPLDPAAVAAALEAVLDDDELATKLSAAGRARATDFTWERTAAATAAAYADAGR
jgi:glycosyltransferase involved in cell wall biosynthesis